MSGTSSRARKGGRGRIVGKFAAFPHAYFYTPEFAELSGRAIKLLFELALQYNGHNNGDLVLTRARMSPRGFRSADQLNKARDELINQGWIMVTRQGGKHFPSLYALTWEPIDRCKGNLDVSCGPTPWHLWKAEHAERREVRRAHLVRRAEQVAPPCGPELNRQTEQGNQH